MIKKVSSPKDKYPIIVETFNNIEGYWLNNLIKKEPTCFNGQVNIQKYRITVERIVESTDVYSERLNKLWAECDNYHHWTPLQDKAKEFGVALIGNIGRNCKNNNL